MNDRARPYTAAEIRALPEDGSRYEVIHGELLATPPPASRHQGVVRRLLFSLQPYLARAGRPAEVFFAPGEVSWDADSLVQPDLFVVPAAEVSSGWSTFKTLLLAVEVVSPDSVRADREVKRRLYQEHGVATYWIVDTDARHVEVWRPEDEAPQVVAGKLHWRVAPSAPELEIAVDKLLKGLPKWEATVAWRGPKP